MKDAPKDPIVELVGAVPSGALACRTDTSDAPAPVVSPVDPGYIVQAAAAATAEDAARAALDEMGRAP